MTIYTNATLQPIYQGQPYTDSHGTQYPAGFPLNEIAGLKLVIETPQPTDNNLVVTGFIIDTNYNQIWQTRLKTDAEKMAAIPSVTPVKARLALRQSGLYDQVNALMQSSPDWAIWWDYTLVIERNNPILIAAATKLGLTSTQIDNLFKLAATL